jgi:hypothetical protein
MKTHHYIFLTTALFVALFYNQDLGLNFGILGIIYAILNFFKTPGKNKTSTFYILTVTSILSDCVCLVWRLPFISGSSSFTSFWLINQGTEK